MNTNTKYEELVARLRANADLDEMEHGNPKVVALEREAADAIEELLKGDRGNLASGSNSLSSRLEAVRSQLIKAGAAIPVPELKGTIESAMCTGLSIALAVVETQIEESRASQGNGGRD